MESPDSPLYRSYSPDSIALPVLAECEQLARARRIKLCCDPMPDVTLLGNSESLERLLLNLVANAIRYTDEDGVVNIKYQIDGI